jgi:hypothetical protein
MNAIAANDAEELHNRTVIYNLMFPSKREEQLRYNVRHMPETDSLRLRNLYFWHIESLRLKDDGRPPLKLGTGFPPWLSLAKVTMLSIGFAYCGYAGIWSVARHIGISEEKEAAGLIPWLINHEIFQQALNWSKERYPDNFALTSKERDEQLLDNLYNRIQSEKNPREYRALVKLSRDAKRDYDKKWKC